MNEIIDNLAKVIVGKPDLLRQAVVALLCKGHLLIEDVPGVGKTVLAKAISVSLSCDYQRVQFTPDVLPSDVTGAMVFDQKKGDFYFRKGPAFTNILLADEINRGTPRTQSSLLECMEEGRVTADGESRELPEPFFVIATQNPIELHGTYPLPEAQLDRFFMRLSIGYPSLKEEVEIVQSQNKIHPLETLKSVLTTEKLIEAQGEIANVHIDESLLTYISKIVQTTREHQDLQLGASPRGSLALSRASQAAAYLEKLNYVKPDHVKAMALPVLRHRLILKPQARLTGVEPDDVIREILEEITVPIS